MNTVYTCGIKINPITTEQALEYVEDNFAKKKKGFQITGVNIEQFALLNKNKNFKDYVNSSDIVNIDGTTHYVAGDMENDKHAEEINPTDEEKVSVLSDFIKYV